MEEGTGEPGLGVPIDDDAAEKVADDLAHLIRDGYSNPEGIHSAAVNGSEEEPTGPDV